MDPNLLPVVVLGIDTPIGLTIVRDLGLRGVVVHGIARSGNALGLFSRYLHQGYLRSPGEEALIEQLADLGRKIGEACLIAISEPDIATLNRHRQRLACFKMLFPDETQMKKVVNKENTYSAADKVGIRVPRTLRVRSFDEAAAACVSLRFPVIVKWANPNHVAPILCAAGLQLDKARYCYSPDHLLAYLRSYRAVAVFPLIQEYCPGYGLGQFILMKNGEARYVFQHRRVREWPPEGGFSSVCESVSLEHHRELMAKSIALLRELEWEGIAMVEYRHDQGTGDSALMEINGRFWGSLPLAYHAGASFPWFTYQLFGLNKEIDGKPYRSGVRCRFMIPETKRLLRVLFEQKRIADRRICFRRVPELVQYLVDFLNPRICYYIFEWRDPAPFLRDVLQSLGQLIASRRGNKV